MRPLGIGKRVPRLKEPQAQPGSPGATGEENRAAANGAPVRPFVERRRRRPLEHSWHEALETLHRMLLRYEEMHRNLNEEEKKYRGLFEDAVIGMFRLSSEGRPLIVNHAMATICGYNSPKEMADDAFCFGPQTFADPRRWRELTHSLQVKGALSGFQAEVMGRGGERKWVQLSVRAIWEDGKVIHYEGTAEEIADRNRALERIELLAYYDSVTGLPNRAHFEEQLADSIAGGRYANQRVALLLLELGRFKMINDSLGKVFGDRLLQEAADRIRTALGEEAALARMGGAEFGIILPRIAAAPEVERIAQQVLAAVNSEFSFLGHSLNLSCTIGISVFPEDGSDAQTLLERADVALLSAKEQGSNECQFFSKKIDDQIRERLKLENGLRLALERHELFLVYQPQIDTRTGQVSGLEALLRWQHPELGLVPPGDFIGVAESSGLIAPIGEWVLRTACWQARAWQDAGLPPVPVAVNVSAIQLRQRAFCDLVRTVLRQTGLDPKYLELELTEGVLLTNVDVMFSLIQELRGMGVKLTIDDFGTGYSSLNYLRQFKVNRLKIDRSFVREVPKNADDAAITTAIINMAKALNLDVVAEGVENAAQLDFLRAQDCHEIQGFYFSKPVAVDQVTEKLQRAWIF